MQCIDELSVNTIRLLAVDGVQKANSGHPGMPMACAPIAHFLYTQIMKHNPENSKWINRDRFILSAGHGSMLLYSILHLSGYKVSIEDLQNFRQWGSNTPGHPEYNFTDGVETTTGPLGQGIANGVGMAIAEKHLAARFNKDDIKLFDHKIYMLAGDGCLMEGISHEACSLAGHLKLDNLVLIYDNNTITIEGHTDIACSDDVEKRFEAYGWNVLKVADVNNFDDLFEKLKLAKENTGKPVIVIVNTVIGYGSPNKKNTHEVHGSPLGNEEVKLTKEFFGFPTDKTFYVPDDVKQHYEEIKKQNIEEYNNWLKNYELYKEKYPEDFKLLTNFFNNIVSDEWIKDFPEFEANSKVATRAASGKVLNHIAKYIPNLIGGSADLAPSTNTYMKEFGSFLAGQYQNRNFHFGIREHAMGSILNGIAMYGGLIPFGATFFVFSDYLRPVLRIAGISHISPKFIFTHDSIGVGEDGPTHQPIEHLMSIRAIPNNILIRPADGNEVIYAYKYALSETKKPVSIVLTRQNVLNIDRNVYASAEGLLKGAYVLNPEVKDFDIILIATGSEVQLIVDAEKKLAEKNIKTRLVSMPSFEIFDMQSDEYKEEVLPKNKTKRISVEAGTTFGWCKYIGTEGIAIGIDKFGASAPADIIFKNYGLTVDNIVEKATKLMEK